MKEDVLVPKRTYPELELSADDFRRLIDPERLDYLPVALMVERVRATAQLQGLEVVTQTDAEMGGAYAYATAGPPPRIFCRESVRTLAWEGNARQRMTVFHEVGHLWLHRVQVAMPRMAAGNKSQDGLGALYSAERQASYWAAAVMMPKEVTRCAVSAEELAQRTGASVEAAAIRIRQVLGIKEARDLPRGSKHNLAMIKVRATVSRAPPRLSAKDVLERDAAWERAGPAVGHNPAQYGLSVDGCIIAKDRYEWTGPYGWYADDGEPCSYEHLRLIDG